jgi:hypothetical protein
MIKRSIPCMQWSAHSAIDDRADVGCKRRLIDVNTNRLVPALLQRSHQGLTRVSRAACYQNLHEP